MLENTEGQSQMDNPEKLTRRRKTQHNMCWTLYANKHKKKQNKTCALLQATGGKDKSYTVLCGNRTIVVSGRVRDAK